MLAALREGSMGIRLQPGDDWTIVEDEVHMAHLRDPSSATAWWFFYFPGLHMDLNSGRLESLRRSAAAYARKMFITAGRQDALEGPLRTDDTSWSPLVDFEPLQIIRGLALRTVHRMIYRPGRELMMGHLLVPLSSGLFEARLVAGDSTTGYRESVVMLTSMDANPPDPNAPALGVDPAAFDAPALDDKFPGHCLSRVRAGLGWLANEGIQELTSPAQAGSGARELPLPRLGGAVTPPPGFVHDLKGGGENYESFRRVSFCGTDGIETLLVELESKRSCEPTDLCGLAESRSLAIHEQAQVSDIRIETQRSRNQ